MPALARGRGRIAGACANFYHSSCLSVATILNPEGDDKCVEEQTGLSESIGTVLRLPDTPLIGINEPRARDIIIAGVEPNR